MWWVHVHHLFQPLLHDLEAVAMPRRSVDHVIEFVDIGLPSDVTLWSSDPTSDGHAELVAESLQVSRGLLQQLALPRCSLNRRDSDRQVLGLVDKTVHIRFRCFQYHPTFFQFQHRRVLDFDTGRRLCVESLQGLRTCTRDRVVGDPAVSLNASVERLLSCGTSAVSMEWIWQLSFKKSWNICIASDSSMVSGLNDVRKRATMNFIGSTHACLRGW